MTNVRPVAFRRLPDGSVLPVVAGRTETKRQIVLYSLLLVPISLVVYVLGSREPYTVRPRRCLMRP